jgi:hypothetical protein
MADLVTRYILRAEDQTTPVVNAAGAGLKKIATEAEAASKRTADALKSITTGNAATATRHVEQATQAVRKASQTAEREVMGLGARTSTLQRMMVAGVAGAATAGIAVVGNMAKDVARAAIGAFADHETAMNDLAARTGRTAQEMEALLRDTANRNGMLIKSVTDGLREMLESGVRPDNAIRNLDSIAAVARNTGQSMSDVARAAFGITQQFPTVSVERALKLIETAARDGNVSISALAQHLPQLAGEFTRFGQKGEAGLIQMLSLLMHLGRNTDDSARAFQGLSQIITDGASQSDGAWAQFHVRFSDRMRVARETGQDTASAIVQATEDALEYGRGRGLKDDFILGELFGNEAQRAAVLAFMDLSKGKFVDIQRTLQNLSGTVQLNKDRQDEAATSLNLLSNAWSALGQNIGRLMNSLGVIRFLEDISHAAAQLSSVLEGLAGYVDKVAGAFNAITEPQWLKDWAETGGGIGFVARRLGIENPLGRFSTGPEQGPSIPQNVLHPTPFDNPILRGFVPSVPGARSPTAVWPPVPVDQGPTRERGPDAAGSSTERTQRGILDTLRQMLTRSSAPAGGAATGAGGIGGTDRGGLAPFAGGGAAGGPSIRHGGAGTGGGNVPNVDGMTAQERNNLALIQRYESRGGQNIPNYRFDAGHTAQGYYQITNQNWRKIAPRLGITAPNAMAASHEEQTRVALALMRESGMGNWTRYNDRLKAAMARGEVAGEGGAAPGPISGNLSALNQVAAGARAGGDVVTSTFRGPGHRLTRANPHSAHSRGLAMDLAAQTTEQGQAVMARQRARFSALGLEEGVHYRMINEADPRQRSPWATGAHVHVQLTPEGAAAINRSGGGGRTDRGGFEANPAQPRGMRIPVTLEYRGLEEVGRRGRLQADREINRSVREARRNSFSDVGVA